MSEIADDIHTLLTAFANPQYRIEQWAGMGPNWTPVTEWADMRATVTAVTTLDPGTGSRLYRLVSTLPHWKPMQFIRHEGGILARTDGGDFMTEESTI